MIVRHNLPRRFARRWNFNFTTLAEPHASRLLNDSRNQILGEDLEIWRRGQRFAAAKSRFTPIFRLHIDRDIKAPSFEVQEVVGLKDETESARSSSQPPPSLTSSSPSSPPLSSSLIPVSDALLNGRTTKFALKWSHDTLPISLIELIDKSLRFTTTPVQRQNLESSLNALWQTFKRYEAEEIRFSVHDWLDELAFYLETMTVDTDALKRQPALASLKKTGLLSPLEEQAERDGLIYVKLDGGEIGCIVNGAGLAMATNDILTHFGSKAANFLDTGGQATTDLLVKAFALLLADTQVKAILVNIFGGLIRCDMIAESIIRAAQELDLGGVPIVVRLRGTNQELGQRMIADSGLALHAAHQIDEAAQKVISLAAESARRSSSSKIPTCKRQFSTRRHLCESERRRALANFSLGPETRVIYQGFTGKVATSNARATIEYGTNVVGGVSPGKGNTTHLDLPVFDTVKQAVDTLQPDVTAIFVPAYKAKDAILEAIDAEIPIIVSVAEGIPIHDMLHVHEALQSSGRSRLIGPNCPGIINANAKVRVGIMPYAQFTPGSIAIISKSGTLSYEAVGETTKHGLGQSIVLGIGGDMLPGTSMVEALAAILPRSDTRGIILIGEIGGRMEIEAADWIKANNVYGKPIVSMIAGHTAPADRVMGHAGALRRHGDFTAQQKADALTAAGAVVVEHTAQLATKMKELLERQN